MTTLDAAGFQTILDRRSGSTIDVSVALAVHREGALLRPTILSLLAAITAATRDGIGMELVVTLDDADDETISTLMDTEAGTVGDMRLLEGRPHCLATARNAGIAASRGEWVCLADGDDLVSTNMFSALYAAARRKRPTIVLMPRWLMLFGERHECHCVMGSRDVGPLNLLSSNPFVSRIFIHRALALRVPFTPVRSELGQAFEDWHHHCQLIAEGCELEPVADTILFYRVRSDGLRERSESGPARMIAPSTFFARDTFLARCRRDYLASQTVLGAFMPPPSSAAEQGERPSRSAIEAAASLAPEIMPHHGRAMDVQTPASKRHKTIGAVYYKICRALPRSGFDEIVIGSVPVADNPRARRVLRIAAVSSSQRISVRIRASRASFSRSVRLCGDLDDCETIVIKLVQAFGTSARLRIADDPFGIRFRRRSANLFQYELVERGVVGVAGFEPTTPSPPD